MRVLVAVFAALSVAAAVGGSVAQATHSGPELRTYGRGVATTGGGGEFQFDFDARLGPHEATDPFGEPHGHMKVAFGTSTASAEVTCLTVVGNRAAIGGRVTRASGSIAFATALFFHVIDNTSPGLGNVVPDEWLFVATAGSAPQVCPAPLDGVPVTRGDIVVEQN